MSASGRSVVAVVPSAGDLRRRVAEGLELSGFAAAVPRGADVALKVNLGWDMFIPGSITSPYFAEAFIEAIRGHVGDIAVVESDQVLEDVRLAFRRSGMAEVCRRTGARWIDMSDQPRVMREAPGNVVLRELPVPRPLTERVLITLPVLKTHAKTVISGALKNQWGCLPRMRHEYHLVLDEAIADINAVMRPAFAAMDGTIGLEGNGPKSGWPRVADRLLFSPDPVALDTVQALAMGIDPARVKHLATAAARGVGTNDRARIEVRGEPLPPVAFAGARHNAVSLVENLLRKSALKRLVFDTPVFRACLWGAKLYYRAWSRRHAAAAWQVAFAHPVYGPLWRDFLAAGAREEPAGGRPGPG